MAEASEEGLGSKWAAVPMSVVVVLCSTVIFCSYILRLCAHIIFRSYIPQLYSVVICRHILQLYSVVLSKLSTHIVNYALAHKAEHFKSKFQYTRTRSTAAWRHRRLCYRPAVFFRSYSRKENFAALKERCFIFLDFLKYISLKMSYFKLLKS